MYPNKPICEVTVSIFDELMKRQDERWDVRFVSDSPMFTLDIIENHNWWIWDWTNITFNPNLNANFVKKYINKPWHYKHLLNRKGFPTITKPSEKQKRRLWFSEKTIAIRKEKKEKKEEDQREEYRIYSEKAEKKRLIAKKKEEEELKKIADSYFGDNDFQNLKNGINKCYLFPPTNYNIIIGKDIKGVVNTSSLDFSYIN